MRPAKVLRSQFEGAATAAPVRRRIDLKPLGLALEKMQSSRSEPERPIQPLQPRPSAQPSPIRPARPAVARTAPARPATPSSQAPRSRPAFHGPPTTAFAPPEATRSPVPRRRAPRSPASAQSGEGTGARKATPEDYRQVTLLSAQDRITVTNDKIKTTRPYIGTPQRLADLRPRLALQASYTPTCDVFSPPEGLAEVLTGSVSDAKSSSVTLAALHAHRNTSFSDQGRSDLMEKIEQLAR
jgi:hypothetical protein